MDNIKDDIVINSQSWSVGLVSKMSTFTYGKIS